MRFETDSKSPKVIPGAIARRLPELFLLALGCAVVFVSYRYGVGNIRQAGPGFFTMTVGVLISLFSLILIASPKSEKRNETQPLLWPTVKVGIFIALYGLFVESFGLLAAIVASVGWLFLTDKRIGVMTALLIAASLAVFSYFVFIRLLGLQIEFVIFRSFVT